MSEQTVPDVYEWIETIRNRKDVAVEVEVDLTASLEEGEDD